MRRILPKRTIKREGTPKFIYLVALLAYLSWAGWGYTLAFVPPENLTNQFIFLTTLFFALFFTVTFLLYEASNLTTQAKPAEIFYPAARRAFLIATFISLSGAMKLVGIGNLFNLTLFGLILLLLEVQITRSKPPL